LAAAFNEFLRERFPGQVCFDTDNEQGIPYGASWEAHLQKKLHACRVLFALIGPDWVGKTENGQRIDDPKDFMRLEIAQTLDTPGKKVIPVLLDPPAGPASLEEKLLAYTGALPENLKKLRKLQIATLRSGPDFQDDATRLANQVRDDLISPLYRANLALVIGGAAYFAVWLYGATLRPAPAAAPLGAAALLAAVLYFFRKRGFIQGMRGILSGPIGTAAALLVACLPLFAAAVTPILRVDRDGLGFSVYQGEATIPGGQFDSGPDRVVGMPFWWAGPHPVPVNLRVSGYAAGCGQARPTWQPWRLRQEDLRASLGRGLGHLVPSPLLSDAAKACASDCGQEGAMTIRLEVTAYLNGKMIPNAYDGPYRSVAIRGRKEGAALDSALTSEPVIAESLPCDWSSATIRYRLRMFHPGETWVHFRIAANQDEVVETITPGQDVVLHLPCEAKGQCGQNP
jgi:hypothetical protein